MNKSIIKAISTFSLTLILILFLNPAMAKANHKIPPSMSLKYVNDYTNTLKQSTKDYIVSLGKEIEYKTGAQSVVVVMDSLNGYDIESYAYALFNQWGIGERGENNGLLILIAIEDRQWKVEVGTGLEGAITDIYSAKVMEEYAVPYFKKNKYDDGIILAYSAYADSIAREYRVSLENNTKGGSTARASKKNNNGFALFFTILVVFILFKLTNDNPWYRRRHRRHGRHRSARSGRSGGFGGFGGGRSRGGGSSGRW